MWCPAAPRQSQPRVRIRFAVVGCAPAFCSGDRLLFFDVSFFNRLRIYEASRSVLVAPAASGAAARSDAGARPAPSAAASSAAIPAATGSAAVASTPAAHGTSQPPLPAAAVTAAATGSSPTCLPAACQSLLHFGRHQQNSGGNTSSKQSLHILMRGEALLQLPYDTQPLLRQVCCIAPFFFSDLDISAFGVALYGRLPPSRPAVFLLKENRKRVQPRKRHVWHALPSAQHHHRDVQLQWYCKRQRHARQLQQQHRRPRRTQRRRCQQRHINQQQRLKQRRTRQQGGRQPHLQLLRSAASIRPSLCCRHDDRAVDSRVTEEVAASTTRRADDGKMSPLEFSKKHELYVDVDLRRYLPSTIATQITEAPTHLQLTKVHSKYTNGSQWSVRTPQIWRDTQRLVEQTDWSGDTLHVWAEPQRQMDEMKTHQQGEEKRKQPPQVPFLWEAGTLLPAVNTDFTSPFLLLSFQSVNQPPLQLLLDVRRERLFLPPSEQQDQVLHLRKEAQLQHNCVMKAVQKFLRCASVPGLPSPVSGRRPAVASTMAPHAVFHASRDGTAAAETGGTESAAAANSGASRCTAVTTNTDNVSFPAAAHAAGLHCQMATAPPSAQEGAGAAAEEPGRVIAAASVDSTYARTTIAYVPSRDGSTAIPVTLLLPAGASSVTVRDPAASLSSLLCEQQRNATPREDGGEVIKSAHASVSSCNGKSSTSMRRTCSRGGTVSMVGGSRRHTGKNLTRNPCLFACVHATSPMRFLVLCYGAYKQPQQIGFSPLISLLLTSQAESGRTRACADVDAPATPAGVAASCVPWGVVIAHTRGEGAAVSEGLSCGRGARKYEGITDLEDVLQWLLACNLTRRDLLVVKACSAGGILAAALYSLQAMRQYAAAVVLKQPFVDPLTSFISTTIEQHEHRQQHHGRQEHCQRHKRQQQQRQQQLGQRPQQQRQQPEQCGGLQQLQKSSRTEPPNVQLPPSAVVQLRQRADEQKAQHQTQVEYREHRVAHSQQPRHPTRQIEYTRRPQKCSDVPGGAEGCRKRQREMVKFSARPFHLREEKEQNVQPTGEVLSPSRESHQVDTHFQRSEEASRLHMGLEHHHRCEFNDSGSAAEGVAPRECDDVTPDCQVAATDEVLCAPADALVAIETEEWGNPFAFTSPAASAAACSAACDTAFTAARPENVAGSAFCPALHFEEEMPLFLLSMLSYSAVDNFHPPRCFTPPTLATPAAAKRVEMGLGVPDSAAAIEHGSLCCSRCGSWRCLGSTYCHVEMLRNEETRKDFGESAASTRNSPAARCSHASSRRSSESWKKSTGILGGFPAAAGTATSTFRRREWPHLWLSASVGDTIVGCWQSCGFLMRLQAMDRLLQQKPDESKMRVHHYQQRVQRHTRQQHFYQQESSQQQQTELQQEVPQGTVYLHKPLKVVQNKELLRPSQQLSNFQIDGEKEWADHRSNIGACVYFRLDGADVGHIGSSNYAARLLEDAEEICFLLKATEVESAG